MEKLVDLQHVERLSERVVRVLGLNPSKFTLQGTNTYLVGTGPARILIDTGEGLPAYLPLLARALRDHAALSLSHVVCTHHHHDHVGGLPGILEHFAPAPRPYKFTDVADQALNQVAPLEGCPFAPLREGEVLRTEGASLRVLHTPGHTSDHICLLLEEEQALFSADCVLGQGSAVFENLRAYMGSLHKLSSFSFRRIYPGHGPIIEDGPAKIREYISHRQERENQVLAVLSEKGRAVSPMEIVKEIYRGYPESLHEAAKGSVLHHLEKLLEENRIHKSFPSDQKDQEDPLFSLGEPSRI